MIRNLPVTSSSTLWGWEENPFLLSKIQFKPAVIDILAQEAGIETGRARASRETRRHKRCGAYGASWPGRRAGSSRGALARGVSGGSPPRDIEAGREGAGSASRGADGERRGASDGDDIPAAGPINESRGQRAATGVTGSRATGDTAPHEPATADGQSESGGPSPSSDGERTFISYVAVHSDDEADPDGLDHQARMELEEKAIEFILKDEPHLQRTLAGNQGFDLIETDDQGMTIRWVEVKAMTGSLDNRPVGMSRAQSRRHANAGRRTGSTSWSMPAAKARGSCAFEIHGERRARSPSIRGG